MQRKFGLTLATALMMFPQIAETIYSPALTDIAKGFYVSPEQATQTLSLYFFAFAMGVVFWGRLCDQIGRRLSILGGLLLYGAASITAIFSTQFELLLIARMLAAFGAAVGSVGTQTIIRDTYRGKELVQAFSTIGVAMAASPAIGMVTGAALTYLWGYQGVFTSLALLAALLLGWVAIALPETRPSHVKIPALIPTLSMMLKDKAIWRSALLIALFNVSLFSYYQLAPFIFERLGLAPELFGSSGVLLALGVGIGAWLNKHLLQQGWHHTRSVLLATLLTLIGGIAVTTLINTWLFILPMILVVMAYGLAIPNILAAALINYADRAGTAGALFGLLYYLMLGIGLALAGWSQHLDAVLLCCSSFGLLLAINAYLSDTLVCET
ncbi:MAG: multidrug effflux MFS transporter [Ottowia sp.]|nr:multidrug effflux MFS transporter [Ottowia sp.]